MNHGPFIWGAYAVALFGLGLLVAVSIVQRLKVRRELAERGLDRKR